MKHLLIFISSLLFISFTVSAQEHNIHPVSYIFNPRADAKQDINDAVKTASKEHKHIFVAVGGDWSLWSRKLNEFLNRKEVVKYMDTKYIIVRVNFSPENRNSDVLNAYSCPKDHGYPIVIVLDEQGNKAQMQDLDTYKVINKWYTGFDNESLLSTLKIWAGLPAK